LDKKQDMADKHIILHFLFVVVNCVSLGVHTITRYICLQFILKHNKEESSTYTYVYLFNVCYLFMYYRRRLERH